MERTNHDEATSLYEILSSKIFTVLSRPFALWPLRRLSFSALSAYVLLCQKEYLGIKNSAKHSSIGLLCAVFYIFDGGIMIYAQNCADR